jgi:Copper type II ascorbate-dependent monooxygenase, C-terminal domain/Copper type II ascorbate-dependent monooxygenase, N-terminal domain
MNVMFMYHPEKPKRGQISLPDPMMAFHPVKPLLLLDRSSQKRVSDESLEIRGGKVALSESSPELLKWCHAHKLKGMTGSQIVRYEPLFSSEDSPKFITAMKLYECKTPMDSFASHDDQECSERLKTERKCFTVVATWSAASEGFSFPDDVGYPITESTDNFLLEIDYQFIGKVSVEDSSGFRIFHTQQRRKFDAGTLSIAIRPNFLHIIAPGFKRVISVAQCTSDCTQKALAPEGINVFGVNMQTHSLGRKIKVGIVRNGEEIEPLAQESNLNAAYIENRVFSKVKKILPGDHITVECTYNTYKREQFTLGGDSADEEICTATLMYYPKQEQLVSCYSQSNIANLLKALGIENLG